MKKIIFDFSLSPTLVQKEREGQEISQLTLDELRRIALGKIFIFFETKREYILLETELIDYLLQIRGVIDHIDSGIHQSFTVSRDCFSNGLTFTYLPQQQLLEISEVNAALFKIKTSYKEFKKEFSKFFNSTMSELVVYYPELHNNSTYINAWRR
jgi:hypothetical protein